MIPTLSSKETLIYGLVLTRMKQGRYSCQLRNMSHRQRVRMDII